MLATQPSPHPFSIPSAVERWYLEQSRRAAIYTPTEKIPVIEVDGFPNLGRLTALRFLEWVLENPEGVVSLPTGKTPEYFIKWVTHYLTNWSSPGVQSQLAPFGMAGKPAPRLSGLHFVQIDEFYPIEPTRHNSFHHYVSQHYLQGFGLDPARALLIDPSSIGVPHGQTLETVFPGDHVDLTLRERNPTSPLEELQRDVIIAVDQFCTEYEARIREMGGIGFFLGGIGPDGHIGFNPRGSGHQTPTRLTLTNYETEAAAASDLGGIEISRHRPVITIGLGTIAYNPQAVVIIFAAGEGKSHVVADAIQNPPHVRYPASVLQHLPNARFYLTTGATSRLVERQIADVLQAESIPEARLEHAVIERALASGQRLDELKAGDESSDRLLREILRRTGRTLPEAAAWTRERLLAKIARGLEPLENQTILHTGPHHDDIMLGYMPYVMHLVRNATNKNHFNILTSGFTAVTNKFMATLLQNLLTLLEAGEFAHDQQQGDLQPGNIAARAADVFNFLDGIASREEHLRRRAQARRLLVNLIKVYADNDLVRIQVRIKENLNYLKTLYPGKKDIPMMQLLKGMQREYEEELIWAYVGTNPRDVHHSRLGFYTGDIFTEQPTLSRDVEPVLALIEQIRPTIVSLAFDPEGAGPDTHYKVLQVLADALLQYQAKTGQQPEIWGYRNVWHRFHPAEAGIFVPATLNTMAIMEHSFMHCFGSQRDASFPSFEHDGPFCYLAERIWIEQYRMLQTCLGDRYFVENAHPRLRAAHGFVFLKSMSLDEFSGNARRLADVTETLKL